MRLFTTLSLSLCLLSPLAAQRGDHGIPIQKKDAEALEAYRTWAAGLPTEMNYPAQTRVDFDMEFDMKIDGSEDFEMEVELAADLLIDGPKAFRSWGVGKVEVEVMFFELDWEFDFNLISNEEGLRMTFIHNHGLRDATGFHLPFAYTLSADRVDKFLAGYAKLIETASNAYLPEGTEGMKLEGGLLGVFHPVSLSRSIGNYPGVKILGWGTQEGKVLLETAADWDMMKEVFAGQPMPFDLEELAGQTYTLVMDAETGALIGYDFEMDMPFDMVEEGVRVEGDMEIEMSMRGVAPGEPKPVEFPEEVKVLDCNAPFDKYWPMMEMMLALSETQFRQMLDGSSAEEDYDF